MHDVSSSKWKIIPEETVFLRSYRKNSQNILLFCMCAPVSGRLTRQNHVIIVKQPINVNTDPSEQCNIRRLPELVNDNSHQ